MSPLTALRIGSIAGTVAFLTMVPAGPIYYSGILSLGMAHYALSITYARGSIRDICAGGRSTWIFLVSLAIGVATMMAPGDTRLKLLFYFAIHHVFNEVYLSDRHIHHPAFSPYQRGIWAAFQFFLYFGILSRDNLLLFHYRQVAVNGLTITGIAFVWAVYGPALRADRSRAADLFAFEAISLAVALAVLSGHLRVRFLDLVMYHFVLWSVWPIVKLRNRGLESVMTYVAGTAAVALIFVLLSPIGFRSYFLVGSWYLNSFYLWSYVHITTSFALSTAQPYWITRLFRVTSPRRETQLVGSVAV